MKLNFFGTASLSIFLRFSRMGIGFLTTFLLARHYGAEITGAVFLVISLLGLFEIIATCGLPKLITKNVGAMGDEPAENISSIYADALKLAVVTCLFIMVVLQAIPLSLYATFTEVIAPSDLRWILSLGVVPSAFAALLGGVLRGRRMPILSGIFEDWYAAIFLLCVVVASTFEFFEVPPIYFVGAWVAGKFMAFLSGMFFIKPASLNRPHFDLNVEMLTSARPFFYIGVVSYLSQWLSSYAVAFYLSDLELGVFNLCWRLAILMLTMTLVFNTINAPYFAHSHESGDIADLKRRAGLTSICGFFLSLVLVFLVVAYGDLLLAIFGSEFVAGHNALTILIAGLGITITLGSSGYLLMMTGSAHLHFRANLMGLAAVICLIPALLPQYGVEGAAVATTSGFAVISLVSACYVRHQLGFWPVASILRSAYALRS